MITIYSHGITQVPSSCTKPCLLRWRGKHGVVEDTAPLHAIGPRPSRAFSESECEDNLEE
jgi:hypothetical protein